MSCETAHFKCRTLHTVMIFMSSQNELWEDHITGTHFMNGSELTVIAIWISRFSFRDLLQTLWVRTPIALRTIKRPSSAQEASPKIFRKYFTVLYLMDRVLHWLNPSHLLPTSVSSCIVHTYRTYCLCHAHTNITCVCFSVSDIPKCLAT